MTWLEALLDEPFVCITDMIRRLIRLSSGLKCVRRLSKS